MKEFSIIKQFCLNPGNDAPLSTGIGDDAAVLKALTTPGRLIIKHCYSTFNDLSDKTISNSLQRFGTLIRHTSNLQNRFLLLNLSLDTVNPDWVSRYLTNLVPLLYDNNIVLAGGDTTQGTGTLVYQLMGFDQEYSE